MEGRTNGRSDIWKVGQMAGRTNEAFCTGRTNGRLDKCRVGQTSVGQTSDGQTSVAKKSRHLK
jgi:hypothetical protein